MSALSLKSCCIALGSLFLHQDCVRCFSAALAEAGQVLGTTCVVALGAAFFAAFARWLERDPTLLVSPSAEL